MFESNGIGYKNGRKTIITVIFSFLPRIVVKCSCTALEAIVGVCELQTFTLMLPRLMSIFSFENESFV